MNYGHFLKDFRQSQLFGSASKEIVDILRREAVTANYHTFCLTEPVCTEFIFCFVFVFTDSSANSLNLMFSISTEPEGLSFGRFLESVICQ